MARINRRGPQRPMELIPDPIKRRAVFSKRHSDLYKKAYELSILCGIDIALVMFSPTDKVYTFGCPNLNSLMDRYLIQPQYPMNHPQNIIEGHNNPNLLVLNEKLNLLKEQFDAEKKRGNELDQMEKSSEEQNWMKGPIDQMTEPKLQHFQNALMGLKKKVQEAERLRAQSSNAESFAKVFSGSCSFHPPQFVGNGNGSFSVPKLFPGEHSFSSNVGQDFAGGSSSNLGPQVQHPPPPMVFLPPMLQNPVAYQNPLLRNLAFDKNAIVMVPTPRSHNNVGTGDGRRYF